MNGLYRRPLQLTFLLVLLCMASNQRVIAQGAFNDSMAVMAELIAKDMRSYKRTRGAVIGISAASSNISNQTIEYIEEVLVMHLTKADSITLVERDQLELVLDEQRQNATGPYDENNAIELGRLLAADVIITGRVFDVGNKIHVLLRLLDTSTGELLGVVETHTKPPQKSPKDRATPAQYEPNQTLPKEANSECASIIEGRILATGMFFQSRLIMGGTVEFAGRIVHREDDGEMSPWDLAVGVQLGYWPRAGRWDQVGFDIGHIDQITPTAGLAGAPSVTFDGTAMQNGSLFLMNNEPGPITFQNVTNAGGQGIESFSYKYYKLRNVRMDIAGFNIPLRWYVGDILRIGNGLRFYPEVGFGMDVVLTKADYETTTTTVQLDRTDYTYTLHEDRTDRKKPIGNSIGSEIWLTHFSLGAGLELGRFNLFASKRWYTTATFENKGNKYERVRGNIIAYPLLAGSNEDQGLLTELGGHAVIYGATGLEKAPSYSTDTNKTITGNGVSRLDVKGYFIFGLSFRFL